MSGMDRVGNDGSEQQLTEAFADFILLNFMENIK